MDRLRHLGPEPTTPGLLRFPYGAAASLRTRSIRGPREPPCSREACELVRIVVWWERHVGALAERTVMHTCRSHPNLVMAV
jgi:hypothetical protein